MEEKKIRKQPLATITANRYISRTTTKTSNNFGIQRKRSRSDIAIEEVQPENSTRILFPERAKIQRKPKLAIDLSDLPLGQDEHPMVEVWESIREEMTKQEIEYAPNPEYLSHQPNLNVKMRAVLLDWMFEVGQEYGLKRDTLHFSVNFVDRFLSRLENPIPRNELQLVGVTALWIASKMEEILPPSVSDFATATDSGCSISQVIDMEGKMMETLGWKLLPCTAYTFANCYLQALATDARRKLQVADSTCEDSSRPWMVPSVVPHHQLNRVMEVLDLALLDYDSLCFLPSVLAATAIISLVERDNSSFFSVRDVENVTNIPRSSLDDCIQWFSYTLELTPAQPVALRPHVLQTTPRSELHTIQRHNPNAVLLYKKYVTKMEGARHPCALNRLYKKTSSLEEDSDDELSAIAIALKHDRLINLRSMTARAFSPMTQISMSLARTTLPNDNEKPKMKELSVHHPSSPQRHIDFDCE